MHTQKLSFVTSWNLKTAAVNITFKMLLKLYLNVARPTCPNAWSMIACKCDSFSVEQPFI